MYKFTVHHVKGDGGDLTPPAAGYGLLTAFALDGADMSPLGHAAPRIVAVWQQEGRVETEWGGQAWRYAPREVERVGEEPV